MTREGFIGALTLAAGLALMTYGIVDLYHKLQLLQSLNLKIL